MAKEVYPTKYPRQFGDLHSVHKTLYLDKSLHEWYMFEIMAAAVRWTQATNGIATISVEIINSENRNKIRNDPDAIVVTMVTEDHPEVIILDEANKESTIAFCNMKFDIPILGYVENRVTDAEFEKVTMHELGHALLLEHVHGPEFVGQIMYPSSDLMGDMITQKDLEQFCNIYHCDATKLKNEEESLHL